MTPSEYSALIPGQIVFRKCDVKNRPTTEGWGVIAVKEPERASNQLERFSERWCDHPESCRELV